MNGFILQTRSRVIYSSASLTCDGVFATDGHTQYWSAQFKMFFPFRPPEGTDLFFYRPFLFGEVRKIVNCGVFYCLTCKMQQLLGRMLLAFYNLAPALKAGGGGCSGVRECRIIHCSTAPPRGRTTTVHLWDAGQSVSSSVNAEVTNSWTCSSQNYLLWGRLAASQTTILALPSDWGEENIMWSTHFKHLHKTAVTQWMFRSLP